MEKLFLSPVVTGGTYPDPPLVKHEPARRRRAARPRLADRRCQLRCLVRRPPARTPVVRRHRQHRRQLPVRPRLTAANGVLATATTGSRATASWKTAPKPPCSARRASPRAPGAPALLPPAPAGAGSGTRTGATAPRLLALGVFDAHAEGEDPLSLKRKYEADTWYDTNGRIVFTASKGLPRVGLPRKAVKGDTSYTLRIPNPGHAAPSGISGTAHNAQEAASPPAPPSPVASPTTPSRTAPHPPRNRVPSLPSTAATGNTATAPHGHKFQIESTDTDDHDAVFCMSSIVMNMEVSQLSATDLAGIDALMKRHSRTLGFLPEAVILDHINRGSVLGAKTDDGRLAGYLLYAHYPDRFRIVQLCVSDEYTKQGIARKLMDKLKETATTQRAIRLRCRRDYPAHAVWPRLGFAPKGSKPGRSSAGRHLELWELVLAPSDQLELFYVNTSDEDHLNVVIDANVFFDFDEPDNDNSILSKMLLEDFLIDHLAISITNEMFVEIDREGDQRKRNTSKQKAHGFHTIYHDQALAEQFENVLARLLPKANPRQMSDIRQIAKTAASSASTFVTRDNALLRKSGKIFELTKVNVVSPTNLLIQLRELSEKQTFTSVRVAGLDLEWRPLVSGDFAKLQIESFLRNKERKGKFKETLSFFFLHTDRYACDLLRCKNEIIAIRVLENRSSKAITIHMGRVARSPDQSMFGRFLIADTISKAVEQKIDMVDLRKEHLADELIPDLIEMGFVENENHFARFCLSNHTDRKKTLSRISELSLESIVKYKNMSDFQLERWCSPLGLENTTLDFFLIPIRPSYAMDLFDRDQSASDFFGGKIKVLLRWENVYYRSRTRHKMLKPPARMLWYVSGERHREIVAISHLDDVEIDSPKVLYRKYRRFGTFDWEDILRTCNRDLSVRLMALKFSHTFLFRVPIPLAAMKAVYQEQRTNLVVQSPSRIPPGIFQRLFNQGYPVQP